MQPDREHAGIMLMFARSDDLRFVPLRIGTMLAKRIQDPVRCLRSIIHQNEFAFEIQTRDRIEHRVQAHHRAFESVAGGYDDAKHFAQTP